jgi:uncharacterized membrane protein YfcA
MHDLVAEALALPGLWPLIAITSLAGVVYGFAGFGAALVFMPLATTVVAPEIAIAAFSISAIASVVTVIPQAVRQADLRETGLLIAAAFLTIPLGLWLLRVVAADAIGLFVSLVVALTLAALIAGYRIRLGAGTIPRLGVGAATGVLGAATGLMGPIVILFNLSSEATVARMRANTALFLTTISLLLLPQMWLQGLLSGGAVALGLILLVPYGVGTWIGRLLFDPARKVVYTRVAYAIIAVSVVMGLPIW